MHFIIIKKENNIKTPLKDLILYLTCFVRDWQNYHQIFTFYASYYAVLLTGIRKKHWIPNSFLHILWQCISQVTPLTSFSYFIIYSSVLQEYVMITLHFCLGESIFVKETHIVKLLIKEHASLLIYMRQKQRFWDTLENQTPNCKESVINSVFKAISPLTKNITQVKLLILCSTRIYHMQKKLEDLLLTLMLPHCSKLRFCSMKCLYLDTKITSIWRSWTNTANNAGSTLVFLSL